MKKLTDSRVVGEKGFTMMELLISLAIGIIVIYAIYDIYVFVMRSSSGMDKSLEAQLELRAGTERMVKELRAGGCYYADTPVITAEANTIQFESDVDPSNTAGPWRIEYQIRSKNDPNNPNAFELVRSEAEWNGGYPALGTPMVMVDNLTALSRFSYFDEAGNVLAPPLNAAARDRVRKVAIAMDSETANVNQATGRKDAIALQTAVQMRCMGVNQSTDVTPCDMGTGAVLEVTDPHVCGKLKLSWSLGNGASNDIAGYRVFYRVADTQTYTGVFDVPGANTPTAAISGLTNGQQYDVSIKCYDTSGNVSDAFTGPVQGTSGTQDTLPEDTIPASLPDVDATASEGEVRVFWEYTTTTISSDLGGYTIYRSSDNGDSFQEIGEADPKATEYFDRGMNLNCPNQPYQYRVTTWDCNPGNNRDPMTDADVKAATVYGDAKKKDGIPDDSPRPGITNTFPGNSQPPEDPQDFKAVAAASSVFLSYITPLKDIAGTRILVSTTGFPTDPNNPTAYGPNDIKDHAPENPNQTYVREDLGFGGNPISSAGPTYYYTAFTFDNCGNFSKGLLTQAATPCGDGINEAEHHGPPNAPGNVTVENCSSVHLSWDAPDGSETGHPFFPPSENDVVGYNIYRRLEAGSYPALPINSSPVTLTNYKDSTVSTGSTYEYMVKAVDCSNNQSSHNLFSHIATPNDIKWDPSVVVTVSPSLAADGTPLAGSQQNLVRLGIESLGNTTLTLDSALITWNTPPTAPRAYLKKVTLVPFGFTARDLWDDNARPFSASGATIDFASFETRTDYRRLPAASTGNELLLDFRNVSGEPNVDMRLGGTITLTLHYTADVGMATCQTTVISIPLHSGPEISQPTQNKPSTATQPNHVPGTVVIGAGTQDNTTDVWTFDDVEVSAQVSPETGTSITSATLYYVVTPMSVATAPATDYSDAPLGWTAVPMCRLGTVSNIYQTSSFGGCTSQPIPASIGKRVWYYIRVVDNLGNTDIEPEPVIGIYNYDQFSFFKIKPLSVTRSGANTTVEVVLKDEGLNPATGATVSLTVQRSNGASNKVKVTMVEDPAQSGTYVYPAAGTGNLKSFSGSNIDVTVKATKAGFTRSECSAVDVQQGNNTTTVICE